MQVFEHHRMCFHSVVSSVPITRSFTKTEGSSFSSVFSHSVFVLTMNFFVNGGRGGVEHDAQRPHESVALLSMNSERVACATP